MTRTLVSMVINSSREGETGEFSFKSTTVFWIEDGKIFQATVPQEDPKLDGLSGTPIPDEAFYDIWVEDLMEATLPLPSDTYIKKPALESYDPDDSPIWMVKEARILEKLNMSPHPNVCKYFGAIREGEYCTGLALQRYNTTLRDAIDGGEDLDRRAIFVGILSGVEHIHSCGFVHNDIHPGNIMLQDDKTPVIVDFDGSDEPGRLPQKTGTVGWHCINKVASFHNDYYSLALVSRWLRGRYDKRQKPIVNPSEDPTLERILNDPHFKLYSLLEEFDADN